MAGVVSAFDGSAAAVDEAAASGRAAEKAIKTCERINLLMLDNSVFRQQPICCFKRNSLVQAG